MAEGGFYVTEQECACGCGTRLSSLTVNRGWKFIRGHKGGTAPGRIVNRQPMQRPGKVMAVGLDQVREYLLQNDQLIVTQLEESRNRIHALKSEVSIIEVKIAKLLAERPKFRAALLALGEPA